MGREQTAETKRKISESRKKYTRENATTWKGGRRINHKGYIEVFMPEHHRARGNGYVFEHIVVAEIKVGRNINRGENVHHIDHDKQNNSPDNLEVMDASEHTKNHHTRARTGVDKSCVVCGKMYYRKLSHAKRVKCCSRQCVGKYTYILKNGGLKDAQ